jgi:hypothetical protein
VTASWAVLVHPGGRLGGLACAVGLHDRADSDRGSVHFSWCTRCGASLSSGWEWVGTAHLYGFSLVSYRAMEAPA